jgi:hypothetical protein
MVSKKYLSNKIVNTDQITVATAFRKVPKRRGTQRQHVATILCQAMSDYTEVNTIQFDTNSVEDSLSDLGLWT